VADAGVPLQVCAECGAGAYPHRLICRRCGARQFELRRVVEGVVEQITVVHRAVGRDQEPHGLATVRLGGGQRVIAGLREAVMPGETVALQSEAGAVWATRHTSVVNEP
jgi:uncharacterized OB-fold protein